MKKGFCRAISGVVVCAVTGAADDDLGVCTGCGACLMARVISFARCGGCGAENYRPMPNGEVPEAKIERFWRRGEDKRDMLRLAPASLRL